MSIFSDAIDGEDGGMNARMALDRGFPGHPVPLPASSSGMNPALILGVLAGGYEVAGNPALPNPPDQPEKKACGKSRIGRFLLLAAGGVVLFAVSSLAGVGLSYLMRQRGKAEPAGAKPNAPVLTRAAQAVSQRAVQASAIPPTPRAKPAPQPAARPVPAGPVMIHAHLIPIMKERHDFSDRTLFVSGPAEGKAVPAKLRAEEVLYEGEPRPGCAVRKGGITISDRPARGGQDDAAEAADEGKGGKSGKGGNGDMAEQAKSQPAAIRVEGIFWDSTRPMALINGDIVEAGARVGSGVIVSIERSSITVEENGIRRIVRP